MIKSIGIRGKRKMAIKKQVKDIYFAKFGQKYMRRDREDFWAPCQCCGLPLAKSQSDSHHKRKASLGGKDSIENFIGCHKSCHLNFIHGSKEREKWVENDPANADNGLQVQWSPQLKVELHGFLLTQAREVMG